MCLLSRWGHFSRERSDTPLWQNLGFKFKLLCPFFPNAKSLGVVKSWEAIGLESANSKASLDEQITSFRAKICYCGWLVPVKSPQSKLLFPIIHDIELRAQGNWRDTKPFFTLEASNSCIKIDVRSRVIRYVGVTNEGVNSIFYTNKY